MKILPKTLKVGDTIGVVAPSNPIIDENIEEMERARKIIEESDIAKKDVSIVDFSESRKDSEFIITEYPNSVSLTFRKKK